MKYSINKKVVKVETTDRDITFTFDDDMEASLLFCGFQGEHKDQTFEYLVGEVLNYIEMQYTEQIDVPGFGRVLACIMYFDSETFETKLNTYVVWSDDTNSEPYLRW